MLSDGLDATDKAINSSTAAWRVYNAAEVQADCQKVLDGS